MRRDENGGELLETAIAHEILHTRHFALDLNKHKLQEEVEGEIDQKLVLSGFTGDLRKWVADHWLIG